MKQQKHRYILLIVSLFTFACFADDMEVITDEYFPYAYHENGQLTGCSVELTKTIIDRLSIDASIHAATWVESWTALSKKQPVMHVVLVRSPRRETRYQWAGPQTESPLYLYALKGYDKHLKNNNVLENSTVACVHGYATCEYLESFGFSENNILKYPTEKVLYGHFAKGTFDLLLGDRMATALKFRYFLGYIGDIKPVVPIDKTLNLYFGFSLATPSSIVNGFQRELDAMKANGKFNAVIKRYLGNTTQ